MGKKVKRVKAQKKSRKDVKKGDLFVITNDAEVADVDGDGVADVTVKHTVTKNGEDFVDATIVWYGLGTEVADGFVLALEEAGLVDEVLETNNFRRVGRVWKQTTEFFKKINKLADLKADELGEDD